MILIFFFTNLFTHNFLTVHTDGGRKYSMKRFTFKMLGLGRTLLLLTAVAALGLTGCGGDDDGGGDNGGTTGGNNNNGGGNNTGIVDPNTVVKGTFTDNRDSKTYKTVKIGSQTWMAENLNYDTADGTLSWCYYDEYTGSADCSVYGRLYDWNTAKTVCPSGWHLPDTSEQRKLVTAVGGRDIAGKKLKSTSGWGGSANGTDDFGFSALPGGYRHLEGRFHDAGSNGFWLLSTDHRDRNYCYSLDMHSRSDISDIADLRSHHSDQGYSVRCVKNN